MRICRNNRGFTLIELLLVVGIVAIILAVIVPLGLRARIDAKYGVVRQNGSELASFASQWVEKSIQAQDEAQSTATVKDYYASLSGATSPAGPFPGQWIAIQAGQNNWNLRDGNPNKSGRQPLNIPGRFLSGTNTIAPPEDCVEDVVPPDKVIRNPFTEVNVFRSPNDPETQGTVVTGALALGGATEGTGVDVWTYYAFAFQGTDNTGTTLQDPVLTFHAGMGLNTIQALRNGIFLGRFR
jgi:prepilin-type N-terminal cleavage/methylation domain-containing protein